jgi:hypothetical protein
MDGDVPSTTRTRTDHLGGAVPAATGARSVPPIAHETESTAQDGATPSNADLDPPLRPHLDKHQQAAQPGAGERMHAPQVELDVGAASIRQTASGGRHPDGCPTLEIALDTDHSALRAKVCDLDAEQVSAHPPPPRVNSPRRRV